MGDTLFVLVSTPDAQELWKSDGTEAGTIRVKVLPTTFAEFVGSTENTVLFRTLSDLWASDGTEAGTLVVKNVSPSKTVA